MYEYLTDEGNTIDVSVPITTEFFLKSFRATDRPYIHDQIFTLIFYGKGGFNFTEIYNISIYLRKFYIQKMSSYEEERKQYEDPVKKVLKHHK